MTVTFLVVLGDPSCCGKSLCPPPPCFPFLISMLLCNTDWPLESGLGLLFTSNKRKTAKVTWRCYYWDSITERLSFALSFSLLVYLSIPPPFLSFPSLSSPPLFPLPPSLLLTLSSSFPPFSLLLLLSSLPSSLPPPSSIYPVVSCLTDSHTFPKKW